MIRNKFKDFSWNDIMSNRTEIFGLVAIWIILFHINNNIGFFRLPVVSAFSRLIAVGNAGVDIFLFLSAIGLYYSISKNTISTFYKNRFARVIIPYIILAIPYFIWYDFIFAKDGIGQFLLNVGTINYWINGEHPVWYVAFIVIAYLIFPLIHYLDKKTRHISTIAAIPLSILVEYLLLKSNNILYQNAERALSRIPIFFFGYFFVSVITKKINNKNLIVISFLSIAIGIATFLILNNNHIVIKRYMFGIIGVSFVLAYSFLRKIFNVQWIRTILNFLGTISFEIYVVHVLLLRLISNYGLWEKIPYKIIWYIGIILVSIFIAKLLSLFVSKFLLKNRKC